MGYTWRKYKVLGDQRWRDQEHVRGIREHRGEGGPATSGKDIVSTGTDKRREGGYSGNRLLENAKSKDYLGLPLITK